MNRRTWTTLALALALAAAPTVAAKTVIEEATADDLGETPHLDVDTACIEQTNATVDGENVVGGFVACMTVKAEPDNRSMYAFEFRMEDARYRLQANYTSEAIPDNDMYSSGWYATLEQNDGTKWTVEAVAGDGDGLTFSHGATGDRYTLQWTVHRTELLPGLAAGTTMDHTKAFSYLNEAETGDAEDDLTDLLSDELDQVDDGSTLGGWVIVDVEPGGTGDDYQANRVQGTVVYGAPFTFQDPPEDADGDGVIDEEDNCPTDYNPAQDDSDGDGAGDACDVPEDDDPPDEDDPDDDNPDDDPGDDPDDDPDDTDPSDPDGLDDPSTNTTDSEDALIAGLTARQLILPLGLIAAILGGVAAFFAARSSKGKRRPPRPK